MTITYRAVQVTAPGVLEMVERQTPTPEAGEVLVAVEACGVCGADASDVDRPDPARLPRVPGHEVVGRIVATGIGVPATWTVGRRVGVGRLGGHCNACLQCRRGHFHLCSDQPFVGASRDGGYAEMMLARSTGLVAIPDVIPGVPVLAARRSSTESRQCVTRVRHARGRARPDPCPDAERPRLPGTARDRRFESDPGGGRTRGLPRELTHSRACGCATA